MKLCRYDDDRLGVVIGDQVHDVTQAQTEIRNSTPYTAKVDPVVAALPKWRDKLEQIEKAGIFLKSNTSLVGPSEGIPMRFPDRRNDHEAELVVIIGKQGSDIPKE